MPGLWHCLPFLAIMCLHPPPAKSSLDLEPYSQMEMIYEKGVLFFNVDVLHLRIRFGPETANTLRTLASDQGKSRTRSLKEKIAQAAIQTRDACLEIRFLRDVELDRFLEEARRNTRIAYEAGIISQETLQHISSSLPSWYSSLAGRGIRKGDRMRYRIQKNSLHTVFQGSGGTTYLDQVDEGTQPGRAVMGCYFAPGSSFRRPLIQTFFEARPE